MTTTIQVGDYTKDVPTMYDQVQKGRPDIKFNTKM